MTTSSMREQAYGSPRLAALAYIKERIPTSLALVATGKAPTLYTLSESTRTEENGYVRLFAVSDGSLWELTGTVATLTGIQIKERNRRNWLFVPKTGRASYAVECAVALAKALEFPLEAQQSAFYLYAI